jgi:hypothetical protein
MQVEARLLKNPWRPINMGSFMLFLWNLFSLLKPNFKSGAEIIWRRINANAIWTYMLRIPRHIEDGFLNYNALINGWSLRCTIGGNRISGPSRVGWCSPNKEQAFQELIQAGYDIPKWDRASILLSWLFLQTCSPINNTCIDKYVIL